MSAQPAPSKIIPNTFQMPNILTDEGLMALLSGNEIKCYTVVIRKTFGWRKDRDRIAKSQIVVSAGISEDTADDCMAALVKFGLVMRTAENNPANEGVEWAPQMDESKIDFAGLQERQASAKSANVKRTEKARLVHVGGGDVQHPQGGDVQQGGGVQQPQGGDVQHPPQQPITASVLVVIDADAGKIFKAYEQEFGVMTPMISQAIGDTIDTYPIEWIPEAMQIAIASNKRSWSYVEGILKNCKTAGKRPSLNRLENKNVNHRANTSKGKSAGSDPAPVNYSDADRAAAERVRERKASQPVP